MKNTFAIGIVGMWLILAVFVGCTTSTQRTTFNTIASVEATASASVNAYYTAVLKGQASTNGVPLVSNAFNDLQASLTLAAAADQAGTNALAPANLTAELTDLLNLINTVKK